VITVKKNAANALVSVVKKANEYVSKIVDKGGTYFTALANFAS
jgi:hypothetical protein